MILTSGGNWGGAGSGNKWQVTTLTMTMVVTVVWWVVKGETRISRLGSKLIAIIYKK